MSFVLQRHLKAQTVDVAPRLGLSKMSLFYSLSSFFLFLLDCFEVNKQEDPVLKEIYKCFLSNSCQGLFFCYHLAPLVSDRGCSAVDP